MLADRVAALEVDLDQAAGGVVGELGLAGAWLSGDEQGITEAERDLQGGQALIVDEHQRNPTYPNIFSVGVCIAIPPVEVTPVPTGCPKTGFMIESMVTATAHNIRKLMDGKAADERGSLSAACLADFGDSGAAFVAIPQIPPRNVNWSSKGKWVHLAKIAFEKYFMRKVRRGISEPGYEKHILKVAGLRRLKENT